MLEAALLLAAAVTDTASAVQRPASPQPSLELLEFLGTWADHEKVLMESLSAAQSAAAPAATPPVPESGDVAAQRD